MRPAAKLQRIVVGDTVHAISWLAARVVVVPVVAIAIVVAITSRSPLKQTGGRPLLPREAAAPYTGMLVTHSAGTSIPRDSS